MEQIYLSCSQNWKLLLPNDSCSKETDGLHSFCTSLTIGMLHTEVKKVNVSLLGGYMALMCSSQEAQSKRELTIFIFLAMPSLTSMGTTTQRLKAVKLHKYIKTHFKTSENTCNEGSIMHVSAKNVCVCVCVPVLSCPSALICLFHPFYKHH